MSIQDIRNRPAILFLYQYNTLPTITIALKYFRDNYDKFVDLDTAVIAITLSEISNCRQFVKEKDIPFPILSDINHMVAESYGVWNNRQDYGQFHWSIRETAFVIDQETRIRKIFQQLKPEQYAVSCLSFIQNETN